MKILIESELLDDFKCSFRNFIEEVKNRRWQRGRHRCVCHVCGDVLDSKECRYSPEACGWMRLKKNIYHPWICHSCLEHHKEDWVKRNNDEK